MAKSQSDYIQVVLILAIVVLSALSRLMGHMPNASPLTAVTLLGAAYFSRKWLVVIVPVLAIWLSDLSLNLGVYHQFTSVLWFYPGFYWQYIAYFCIAIWGIYVFQKSVSFGRIAGATLGSGLLFFLITNFGVWLSTDMYAHSAAGLRLCFQMAIPFYRGTLAGDVGYVSVLFGGYLLMRWMVGRGKLDYGSAPNRG